MVNKQTSILFLLITFISMWSYTEITEYLERDQFIDNVERFMYKGSRFTNEDGLILELRIEALEEMSHEH